MVSTKPFFLGIFLMFAQLTSVAASNCSITSEDESETCSITCPHGQAALCTRDQNTVDCKCEESS